MLKFRIPTAVIALTLAVTLIACGHRPDEQPPAGGPDPAAPQPSSAAAPTALPSGLPQPEPGVWASWALFDRATGATMRGGDQGTTNTESMIKVAIAAQTLREFEQDGTPPTDAQLHMLEVAVRDSDNEAAEFLYRAGGRDKQLQAVIDTCGLSETTLKPGWWSETQITAADAAAMGACIANGRICSAEWTTWLLGQMRSVRGVGRFGIIDVRPSDNDIPLAIKNGWQTRDDHWDINCLAVADGWSLTVLTRYPITVWLPDGSRKKRGMDYGATLCAQVAAAIAPPDQHATEPNPARSA